MVPVRFVFRSRWWALAWAAGICWSATQFAGTGGHEAAGNGVASSDANDMNAVADALLR